MAKFYLKNPYVVIDGHDFSTLVRGVTVEMSKDEIDTTASGDSGHTQIPGLSKDSFTLDLYQDKDMSVLDRVLYNIYAGETAVLVAVTSQGSTVSEQNAEYTGSGKLFKYTPISGQVGSQAVTTQPQFMVDGAITRTGT